VINYGDLRGSAARQVGKACGANRDGVRCRDCAGGLIVHLQIVTRGQRLARIAGCDANLADGAVTIGKSIDRPGHRIVYAAENLRCERDAMIPGERDSAGRKRHPDSGLNCYSGLRSSLKGQLVEL